MNIFDSLKLPLQLEYLELAIGSNCRLDFTYPQVPLILHDSCLYDRQARQLLKLFEPKTWAVYADFIQRHQNVAAVSIHAPRRWECSGRELEAALKDLQQVVGVPVAVEIMPTCDYWCSSMDCIIDFPLLLDVSHVLIWQQGNFLATENTCDRLLKHHDIIEIHLSHNCGRTDTHQPIPDNIWFDRYLSDWRDAYLVTYESLPRAVSIT
jgi:hypothetical protein